MHEQLVKYLDGFLILDCQAALEVRKNFGITRYAKGEVIVRAGETVDQIHFIAQGCCRHYTKQKNKSITHWFGFENSFATAFYSLTTGNPSQEYIQLLEDSIFLSINYPDLLNLYNSYQEWARLGRLILEDFGRHTLHIINSFRTLSPKQRYLMLLQKEPRIIQRVPLGYISSYLGITQEALSRIRSRIR